MEIIEQPNYRFHNVPSQNVVYSIFKLSGASIMSKLLGKLSRSNQPDRELMRNPLSLYLK